MVDLSLLLAPFPMGAVSWRAQTLTKTAPYKALALAYIDARDVMKRLDDVCGMDGWQCEYPHANGKTICSIGLKSGEEWIWKADGAGDTDIEAEKGAISDAFKRAAVKWGIGRYLYDLDAVWVPCEAKEWNGKMQFVKFTEDPWKYVKPEQKSGFVTAKKQSGKWEEIADNLRSIACESTEISVLEKAWTRYLPDLTIIKRSDPEIFHQLEEIKDNAKMDISVRAGMPQGFNGAHQ